MHFAGCEADERSQGKRHLVYFRGESWVAGAACGLHDDVVGASVLKRRKRAVCI